MVTELVGDHLSRGTKFLGTICPWGPEVGNRKSGDQMSRSLKSSGLYSKWSSSKSLKKLSEKPNISGNLNFVN